MLGLDVAPLRLLHAPASDLSENSARADTSLTHLLPARSQSELLLACPSMRSQLGVTLLPTALYGGDAFADNDDEALLCDGPAALSARADEAE